MDEATREKQRAYYQANKQKYAERARKRLEDPEKREQDRYYKQVYYQSVTKQRNHGIVEVRTPLRESFSRRVPSKFRCCQPRKWSKGEVKELEPREVSFD